MPVTDFLVRFYLDEIFDFTLMESLVVAIFFKDRGGLQHSVRVYRRALFSLFGPRDPMDP